ncbi:MAG: SRPBCC domain-containing protein [Azospirillaceae bacterium]
MNATGQLEHEVYIEAPQPTVFAFLTDPEKMVKWMGITSELDPREGGIYRVNIDNRHIARGTYQEVRPNDLIVFSFGWEGEGGPVPAGASRVTITLDEAPPGTKVTLVHDGLPEPAVEPHREGWTHYCARLCVAAAGGDPGPDPKRM